ncbi:hypothetical protein ACFY1P_32875 [Streptomyces sp. NPDC001407]|uniref:hypothetical protein n=1 Tax=Streptomyces sp. NPDC001407 TaxID=3364573 RepID=UPI003687D004
MSVRDEVLAPFRGLPRDIRRGTPVLTRHIARGLHVALRAVLRGIGRRRGATTALVKGHLAEAGEDQQAGTVKPSNGQLTGPPWKKSRKDPPAAAPAPTAGRSLADMAETAATGFLTLAVAATVLGMVLGYLGQLLAPYRWGIALGLAIAWCFAAAIAAPQENTLQPEDSDSPGTQNDHEKSAGEEPSEPDEWPLQRQAVRELVEGKVAAAAAGHAEAKGKGARIDDILAGLQAKGIATTEWDRKTTREFLGRAGITVRDQMKFRVGGEQQNQPGVHVDDLAEDLGRRPLLPAHLVPDLTRQQAPAGEAPTTR